MKDRLEKYREKRDPGRTNEPFSAEHQARSEGNATWKGRFVIHQHAATRMHYDLRLQIGNTLQSFAVPRGLALDPKEKHLAVHTEDHPLEYLFFEDVIPAGNYGAGNMIVWDTGGFYFNEASGEDSLVRGKLDFVLDGFKAKGRFALIATGRRKAKTGLAGTQGAAAEWLLIKKKDAHSAEDVSLIEKYPRSVYSGLRVEELSHRKDLADAFEKRARALVQEKGARVRTPLHSVPVPMICDSNGAPTDSKDWLYELKLDGVRIVATKSKEEVTLQYRSGRTTTKNYADVARALRHLPVDDVVLDGEIVTFDGRGRPSFSGLAPRIQARKASDIVRVEAEVPVIYMIFDVLRIGPVDVRGLPLEARKALVQELVKGQGYLRALDHIQEKGSALWALCEQEELEGMVAKRLGSSYAVGPRASGDWVKIKRQEDNEFVVVGFTIGDEGGLKALCLGAYVGERLVYRGRVGGGFSAKQRKSLLSDLKNLSAKICAVEVPKEVPAYPVHPELVVKVRSQGFSEGGHLRAPVFLGVHEDKEPRDCTAGPNDEVLEAPSAFAERGNELPAAPPTPTKRRAKLTNLTKVYWPNEGLTKGDLLAYYENIAPLMLPHLKDRPVVLVRYPDGIDGKSFYQWRAPEGTPSWIRTFELYDEEKQSAKGSGKAAFLIDSEDALLHIANLGCIPIHVLAGRENTREACDFLTIDLDLGERAFADGVRLALTLKEILDELELPSFPKTSGQRGLHILIPLGPGVRFESAKLLCELIGRLLVGRHSDMATMERRIEKRGDKIYVDTGQTGRSRTIVAPYSVRAFPGGRVSTPLRWQEIHLALDPGAFTMETVVTRAEAQGDPMAELLNSRPNLPEVMKRLASWTGQ